MKVPISTIALLLAVPISTSAQSADRTLRGEGYFFLGPIVSNARYEVNPAYYGVVFPPGQLPADYFLRPRGGVNAGLGGEVFGRRGFGMGAEVGYAGQDWSFSGNGVGVGSLNASYHFLGTKNYRKVEPFLSGGYSLYFGDRTAFQHGLNLGGGVNIWVVKHAALRLEIRDQEQINYFHSQLTRFVAFRVGMTFR